MREIMLIGKSILGEEGFCLKPEKMQNAEGKDIFYDQLEKIKAASQRETVITTSITSMCDLEEVNYDYLPTVLLYNDGYRNLVNPCEIYMSELNGTEPFTPNVDFIVWNSIKNPNAVMTFSNTAPTIYMESKNGMCCLGVILRKALLNHWIFILDKILKAMQTSIENPVDFVITSCTDFYYDDIAGTLSDYIHAITLDKKEIRSFRYLYNVNTSNECYKNGDKGNHVILIK